MSLPKPIEWPNVVDFEAVRQLFMAQVAKSDFCWEWAGKKTPLTRYHLSYGQFRFFGRTLAAHRVAWELDKGPIPHGLLVCHACDNSLCVRSSHLFLGTSRDNSQDAVEKGRMRTRFGRDVAPPNHAGSLNPASKISLAMAEEIVGLRSLGMTYRDIAQKFPIGYSQVRNICVGIAWRNNRG